MLQGRSVGAQHDAISSASHRFFATILRYSVAPASIFLATVLVHAVRQWTDDSAAFLIYVIAVALSTWFAGAGPGALSIILSALSLDFFFTEPFLTISPSVESLTWTLIFVCVCAIAYLVSLQRKRAEQSLRQARDELEERVAQRTMELTEANAQLTREITERERTAQEMHDLQIEMARMSRILTVGALTASITHEINQPLTSVVANCEAALSWLKRDTPDFAKTRQSISSALSAGYRAADILRHIRSLIDRGPSRLGVVSLGDIVERALTLSKTALRQNQVQVDQQLSSDTPQILADRVQLEQLVLNLINNAIDALADVTDRQRTIAIALRQNDDGRVELVFRDNGCGMPEEQVTQAFKPFFSTKPSGIGMGLSIIHSIVQRHHGSIRVRSTPGIGTEFTLTFEPVDSNETSQQHRVCHR